MSLNAFLQIADVMTILGLGGVTYFLFGYIGQYSQQQPTSPFSRFMKVLMAHELWIPALLAVTGIVALILVFLELPMGALAWFLFAFILILRLRRFYRPARIS
jgi:hypothetical protein